MTTYHNDVGPLRYAPPSVLVTLDGCVLSLFGSLLLYISSLVSKLPVFLFFRTFSLLGKCLLVLGGVMILAGVIIHLTRPDAAQIAAIVRRGLCDPRQGNPLHLREGESLPRVRCAALGMGRYALTISCAAVTVEDIAAASSAISTALQRQYAQYAVTAIAPDIAYNHVTFSIADVTVDQSLTITDVEDLRPSSPTKLMIDKVNSIDLTTSGHILVAGKTRSGKTTGIIALLLQVLMAGPDTFCSKVVVIDPKVAELSVCPHTVTLDDDGEARGILAAIEDYAHTVVERQAILNDQSRKIGDAVHWWEVGFHPSFLFIDEYVALRSLLPKKPEKGDEGYSLAAFDGLLRRIITTGASTGCYVIISIAEASVEEGGLPAMLRSAMSTRILFRPTMAEARLLWPPEKLEALNTGRVYGPGDAWFSSTDGEHDNPGYVHFPYLKLHAYEELGRLLQSYYETPNMTPTASAVAEQSAEAVSLCQ